MRQKPARFVLDRSSFRKEATSRTSISEQFRENGITCVKSEKDVNVGIDFLKKFMRGDGALPWIYFSTRCAEIIRARAVAEETKISESRINDLAHIHDFYLDFTIQTLNGRRLRQLNVQESVARGEGYR